MQKGIMDKEINDLCEEEKYVKRNFTPVITGTFKGAL